MKIFIDIGHPAHVHYFKNLYRIMTKKGHEFLITARKKEVSHELLKSYGIPFFDRGSGSNSMIGKFGYLPKANWLLFKQALKFKPDLFMSFSSPYAAQVSSLFRKPHIAFDDTEHAWLGRLMYRPFTDLVLSPDSYNGTISKKQKLFNGYMELLYLHPNHFTPDETILDLLSVKKGEKYVLLRFVSWKATHDAGHNGMSLDNKRKAVQEFSKYAKVFISSEAELPEDLESYRITIPPAKMHDLLNYSLLFFGESGTMASESAMLGTHAIFLNDSTLGYLDDLEKRYDLINNFTESIEDQERAIRKGVELLQDPNLKQQTLVKRYRMLEEKIDVTNFLVEYLIDNYS
jgi:predicted glycosyltransferase